MSLGFERTGEHGPHEVECSFFQLDLCIRSESRRLGSIHSCNICPTNRSAICP